MIQYAWETRSTHFDYYFFSENCSYFLLSVLEAARPELHLQDDFSGWVIPSDTVRVVLAVPGLVRTVSARPSLRSAMLQRKKALTRAEVKVAEDLSDKGRGVPPSPNPPALQALTKQRQALIIDAAYDRLRYTEGFKAVPSARFERIERDLFVLRGRTGVPPVDLHAAPEIDAPERGHPTFQVGAGLGFANSGGTSRGHVFEDLSVRPSIHDLLDSPIGYPKDATLEMGHLRLRLDNETRRAAIDRLDVVQIVSATPFDRWAFKPAWRAWIGGEQLRALGCEGWDCLTGGVIVGTGLAAHLGPPLLLWTMLETDLRGGRVFEDRYRLGLGGTAAALLHLTSWWRAEGRARYVRAFAGDHRHILEGSIASAWDVGHRAQIRLGVRAEGSHREGHVEVGVYF
jgi:hypothetical protein